MVTRRDPSTLRGVVYHWFGIPNSVHGHKDCAALVRSVQRSHQAGEFNDIAYNHLVCRHGYVFEGRGFGAQTGANGNSYANQNYAAVCLMVGVGDGPEAYTPEAMAALAEIAQAWHAKGAGPEDLPHGHFTGSECPGPQVRQWLAAGGHKQKPKPAPKPAPKPEPKPEPPKPKDEYGNFWSKATHVPLKPDQIVGFYPDHGYYATWPDAPSWYRRTLAMKPLWAWILWRRQGHPAKFRPPHVPATVPKAWWVRLAINIGHQPPK